MLSVSLATAYNLLREEPGVHRIYTPGATKKPIIRVERRVVDRILQRSSVA